MSWARVAAARLAGLWGRARGERELDDEVRFHLEMQVEDNLKAGMTAEEARYAALRSFGGIAPMRETYRERRAFALLETIAQDLRYAVRTLSKSPGYTATTVAVLALGIGANTAMFSVLNAVLLRPLPFRSPEQLAMLWSEVPSQNLREGRPAYGDLAEWRSRSQSFADMAFFDPVSATLTSGGEAEHISVARISPNFFGLLGVAPLLGRTFTAEEAEQRQRLALISEPFWQTRFSASPEAIGASIELDGRPSRIIGVMPRTRQFADADVWEPHTLFADWEALRRARGAGSWVVVGRLRPEVTFQQAQAELSAIARRLDEQASAANQNRGISVVPLSLQLTGARQRLALWMLTGAVFLVLLIAATNVASLSLARSASREREMATRAALGASRWRIIRQLLAESLALASVAGLLGLLVAAAGIQGIAAFQPGGLARGNEAALDLRVLGCAMGLCLLTGILVGLAPAITVARGNLRPTGAEGGRASGAGVAGGRLRRLLVVTEFALALILLAGAGLLVRSLWSIQNVDPGFRPDRVLSMQLASPAFRATAQRAEFYQQVLAETDALPGVEGAGMIGDLLIAGSPERVVTAEGEAGTVVERFRFRRDEVSAGVFRTLGTPLLRGRFFAAADGPDAPRVAILNEAMGQRLWPGREAVGKRFKPGLGDDGGPWITVVGMVANMRRQGLEQEAVPQMFEPLAQNPSRLVTLLVKTSADDAWRLAGAVKAAVHRVEKHAAVYGVTTLEGQLDRSLSERRLQTTALIGFSVVALLMAAIGIYGLIQYSIAARTHEIGIRVAIGAQGSDIFRMIIQEGLQLSFAGLGIGLAGAFGLGRTVASLLFGVASSDPATFLTVSVLLLAVATAACYFPARRAMKIDAMAALRQG